MVTELAIGLHDDHGIDSVFVSNLPLDSAPAQQLQDHGIDVVQLYIPSIFQGGKKAIEATWAIARHPKLRNSQIVHGHDTAAIPFIVAFTRRAKLAFTIHLNPAESSGASAWIRETVHKRFLNRADAVVAVSKYIGDGALDYMAGTPMSLSVILNGCDTSTFRPGPPRLEHELLSQLRREKKVIFGIVGNIEKRKLPAHVVEIAKRTAVSVPEAAFVFVGTGHSETETKEAVQALGLENRVHFLGLQTEMRDIYCQLDALLHLCPDEGLPLAYIEAMACALPVIGAEGSSVREVVVHNSTGFVCTNGDWDGWESAIVALRSPEMRKKLGREGRARAEEKFSIGAMCHAYAALYERLARGA